MGKHEQTLNALFAQGESASIKWRDIESLLIHHGADITEGKGSRVRVRLNDVIATFHRPHPSSDTKKGAVKSVRKFLEEAGISP